MYASCVRKWPIRCPAESYSSVWSARVSSFARRASSRITLLMIPPPRLQCRAAAHTEKDVLHAYRDKLSDQAHAYRSKYAALRERCRRWEAEVKRRWAEYQAAFRLRLRGLEQRVARTDAAAKAHQRETEHL